MESQRGRWLDGGAAMEILCEDGPVIAVNKPPGVTTQGAAAGEAASAAEWVKAYLKTKYAKPGAVYLGIVHRLDRPVSGALIFARNSKAAARLAEQFRLRQVRKIYWAVVERPPVASHARLADWLLKRPDETRARIVEPHTPDAQPAVLSYRVLARTTPREPALLEIELETGRRHQIRAQLAHHGSPILGDRRYGSKIPWSSSGPPGEAIALHARELTLLHPIRREPLTLTAPVPPAWRPLLRKFGVQCDD